MPCLESKRAYSMSLSIGTPSRSDSSVRLCQAPSFRVLKSISLLKAEFPLSVGIESI